MDNSPFPQRVKSMRWSKEDTQKLEEIIQNGTKYRDTNEIVARYPQFAKYGIRRLGKKIVYLRTYKPHPLIQPSKIGTYFRDGADVAAVADVEQQQQQQQQQQQYPKDVVVEHQSKGNGRGKHGRTSIISTPYKNGYAFTTSGNVKMNLMHMSHMWMNIDSHEYITIQMNLPSGVNIQDIDRVLQVNISDDGMNVIVIIDWPSVLTDSNIIQSGWECTNSTLTEDMKRQMFHTIDSNILLLKERLNIPESECIKGECKISLEKECVDDIVDMCVHHEGIHGGLVLYITTKVRMLSKQAKRKKIQVTSVPTSRNGVPFNNNNNNTTSTGVIVTAKSTITGTQQHSNAPTTPIPHTLPVTVLTDPTGSIVVPKQMNNQHDDETSVQQEGGDILTTSGKKTKIRSSDTNSCTSNNEKRKNHRKDETNNNNADDRSFYSASSVVKKKAAEAIPVSNKRIQNDNVPNSVSVQQRHNKLPPTTENNTTDSNDGNDVDDDDGSTTSIRTDVTDLVEGLLQVGQERKV